MLIASPLRRLLDVLDDLVDPRVGIIRQVAEFPRLPGSPEFFHFHAQAANTLAFTTQQNFASAGGASTDRARAMAKAIGEAVERYCAAIYDLDDFDLVSSDLATFRCIPPEEFVLYRPEQYRRPGFPYVRFTSRTHVRWTETKDLFTGEKWYVPAPMVFIPYFYDPDAGEPAPIVQPISTGLACHCSWEEAALSGIGEVIERDAFTITWQARLGWPHIRHESLSPETLDLIARFHRTGHTVTLLNMKMDHGIPSILALLEHPSAEMPALVCAAASNLDPEAAVRSSLEELAHTSRMAVTLNTTQPPFNPGPDYRNVWNPSTHVHLHCDHKILPLTRFLLASSRTMDFGDIEDHSTGDPHLDLRITVDKVRATGHRVLVADISTPDVGELGLRVVRAVIPGFHPLFMGHAYRALGGKRLWEVPQRCGFPGITPEAGDNPVPHPFP